MVIDNKEVSTVGSWAIAIIIAMVYLSLHYTGYYPLYFRIITTLGLIPALVMGLLCWKTKSLPIGLYFLVLYQTWNYFLVPYTWKDPIESGYRIFNTSDFPNMAIFSLLSIYALYFGLIRGMATIKPKPLLEESRFTPDRINKLLIWMIAGGYVIGVVQVIISSMNIPFGLLTLLSEVLPATIGAVWFLYLLRGGRSIIISILVVLYMFYYIVYNIGSTMFISSILIIVAPTVVYMIERKKIPYKTLIAIFILILPIYLSRLAYRQTLYEEKFNKFAYGLTIIGNEYSNISVERWKNIIEESNEDYNIDNRMDGVTYLGTCVNSCQTGQCRYLYGETMAWLPTMILPHVLIPFRPGQNMGDQWAEYYGLKMKGWRASINFPMLCEFYVNFGYLGMIIFEFLNGLLIVWFVRKTNEGRGDANLLLLIFIVTKIIIVESNVSLSYGAILQIFFIVYLWKKYVSKKSIA